MKTKNTILLALGLVILVAIAGCTPTGTGLNTRLGTQTRLGNLGTNNNWRDGTMLGQDGMLNNNLNTGLRDGMGGINNNLPTSLGNLNTNASELARKIGTLPEVTSAAVVVSNNKAVVGVNLRGTNQNTISTALRQKIETMVKETNRNITNVSVTSDPTLFREIQTMSNGTNNGSMMNTINTDIDDLIRRITPNTNNLNR